MTLGELDFNQLFITHVNIIKIHNSIKIHIFTSVL